MEVTMYKCERTNKLFEDKEKFDLHNLRHDAKEGYDRYAEVRIKQLQEHEEDPMVIGKAILALYNRRVFFNFDFTTSLEEILEINEDDERGPYVEASMYRLPEECSLYITFPVIIHYNKFSNNKHQIKRDNLRGMRGRTYAGIKVSFNSTRYDSSTNAYTCKITFKFHSDLFPKIYAKMQKLCEARNGLPAFKDDIQKEARVKSLKHPDVIASKDKIDKLSIEINELRNKVRDLEKEYQETKNIGYRITDKIHKEIQETRKYDKQNVIDELTRFFNTPKEYPQDRPESRDSEPVAVEDTDLPW